MARFTDDRRADAARTQRTLEPGRYICRSHQTGLNLVLIDVFQVKGDKRTFWCENGSKVVRVLDGLEPWSDAEPQRVNEP